MSNFPVDAVPPMVDFADPLVAAAHAAAHAPDLEGLTRPLLGLLHRVSDFDSWYLTVVDPVRHEQQVLFVDDRSGRPTLAEGMAVDWEQAVCRQSLATGVRSTTDATAEWPEQNLTLQLGIRSYVSVPVRDADKRLLGTLCAVSRRSVPAGEGLLEVMELLARLLADRWPAEQTGSDRSRREEVAEARLFDSALVLTEAEQQVRAPLLMIESVADQLLGEWAQLTDPRRVAALQSLHRAAHDVSSQFERLLTEAREDALVRELQIQPVDLGPIIDEVVSTLRRDEPGRTVRHPQGEAARVRADRAGLRRALRHLVGYAAVHSEDASVLDVAIRSQDTRVVVTIEGRGIILPPGDDVFDPFAVPEQIEIARLEAGSSTVTAAGPGLTLYVARNLVQAMGGGVGVNRSAAADTLSVWLPAA